jgi:hypothetical protein
VLAYAKSDKVEAAYRRGDLFEKTVAAYGRLGRTLPGIA